MITVSFKLAEDEAHQLRSKAHKAKMTESHFLRQCIKLQELLQYTSIKRMRCPKTGAMIFSPKQGHLTPLTTGKLRAMLTEFP